MTPQFTTPCFVRIDDADKRKEVCEKLEPIGYKIKVDYTDDINPIVVASKLGILHDSSCMENPKFINCGTDIDLFLALAGMRSDTDMGQWFISKGWKNGNGNPIENRITKCLCNTLEQWGLVNNSPNSYNRKNGNPFGWERATAAEIVQHFNNKSK